MGINPHHPKPVNSLCYLPVQSAQSGTRLASREARHISRRVLTSNVFGSSQLSPFIIWTWPNGGMLLHARSHIPLMPGARLTI